MHLEEATVYLSCVPLCRPSAVSSSCEVCRRWRRRYTPSPNPMPIRFGQMTLRTSELLPLLLLVSHYCLMVTARLSCQTSRSPNKVPRKEGVNCKGKTLQRPIYTVSKNVTCLVWWSHNGPLDWTKFLMGKTDRDWLQGSISSTREWSMVGTVLQQKLSMQSPSTVSRMPTTALPPKIRTTEADQLASPSTYKYQYKYK